MGRRWMAISGLVLAAVVASPHRGATATTVHAANTRHVASMLAPPVGCTNCYMDPQTGAAACSNYFCVDGVLACSVYNAYLCLLEGACTCCTPPDCPGGGGGKVTLEGSGIDTRKQYASRGDPAWGSPTLARNCAGVILARTYDESRSEGLRTSTNLIRM